MTQAKTFDGVGFLALGDTVLIVWQAAARVERNRWLFDNVDATLAENPGGIIILQHVLQSSNPPDKPARAENDARVRKLGANLRRLVTVPVGDALWGALVRAVMRALMLVTSSSKALFVASSEEHGVDVALISASRQPADARPRRDRARLRPAVRGARSGARHEGHVERNRSPLALRDTPESDLDLLSGAGASRAPRLVAG